MVEKGKKMVLVGYKKGKRRVIKTDKWLELTWFCGLMDRVEYLHE